MAIDWWAVISLW